MQVLVYLDWLLNIFQIFYYTNKMVSVEFCWVSLIMWGINKFHTQLALYREIITNDKCEQIHNVTQVACLNAVTSV